MAKNCERKRKHEEVLKENSFDHHPISYYSSDSEDGEGCCGCGFPLLKEDPKLLTKSYWDNEWSKPAFNEAETMADFDDDDSDYIPSGETKADRKLWLKYFKQIWESDGFDVEDFPGPCIMREIVPDSICEKVYEMARLAIDKYNFHNGEAYQLVGVEKVNSGPAASLYYITFRAKNTKSGSFEEEVFQAKTFGEKSMVILCRPKLDKNVKTN